MGNFEAAKKLLSAVKIPVYERQQIYFLDWQLIPLFIQ